MRIYLDDRLMKGQQGPKSLGARSGHTIDVCQDDLGCDLSSEAAGDLAACSQITAVAQEDVRRYAEEESYGRDERGSLWVAHAGVLPSVGG
jgi:hypothetical protein